MKFKTLLLGTAAAFAVGGTAQAADLAVAESVEYVKVCDAYGAGYFYIPGSDTCLKIGGFVRFNVDFENGIGTNYGDTYDADWQYDTVTSLNATAKWMTDWGAATVFVDVRTEVNEGLEDKRGAYLDTGWFKIGGLKMGWDGSTFESGLNTGYIGKGNDFDHDEHQQQIQWSTTIAGYGFFIAAEDPRDNADSQPPSSNWTGNMPDLVVALTGSSGAFSWKLSAAATDTIFGTGWGTQFMAGWSQNGNFLQIQAAVSDDAGALYGANLAPSGSGDDAWHVTGSGGIAWSSAFTTVLAAEYRAQGGFNQWGAAVEGDWKVAKNATTGVAVRYSDANNASPVTAVEWRTELDF